MLRATRPRSLVLGSVLFGLISAASAADPTPPWKRTETHQTCGTFDSLRLPFFGDLHVHTTYSGDAVLLDVRTKPRDAYRFALGQPIDLPPYDGGGVAQRTASLVRPLDFTAVTDHAEGFGEMDICFTPGFAGYDSTECQGARSLQGNAVPSSPPDPRFIAIILPYAILPTPQRFSWCGPGFVDCLSRASLVWQDIQEAAEEFYDRTSTCGFTTFVAYEWSATPLNKNLHRNVIFRNAVVPALPTSYMERSTADGLWAALQQDCIAGLPGCDVLAIPHNSNGSAGAMFAPLNGDGSPMTAATAAARAAMEPLVEIMQWKGSSECRPGSGTTDEQCGFESINRLSIFSTSTPGIAIPPLSFVRNGLLQGLATQRALGVNPFQLGVIGSTDTHNSTPGAVNEIGWPGATGTLDDTAAFQLSLLAPSGIDANPGGLAVLWAEENSRDALFAAMRRREAYATSGTRPVVRAFAGKYAASLCKDPNLVATGYARGVPMGGEIGPVRGSASPSFALLATKDPGAPGESTAPLERIQMVKGWIDAGGQTHEKVFDVAGGDTTASADPATCAQSGSGHDSLCTVWRDPEFNAGERAFYYARVLETPTCRWSTRVCNDAGVDCSAPATVPPEYATCCNPAWPKTVQERAWTSPHWYQPDGVASLSGSVHFGASAGRDVLDLRLRAGAAATLPDLATQDLTIAVYDDDDVYRFTVPAGTLAPLPSGAGWKLVDRSGAVGGLGRLVVKRMGVSPLSISLRTRPGDFSSASRSDHIMQVDVSSGAWRATHVRRWTLRRDRLSTR
jgi:hypothetical protein